MKRHGESKNCTPTCCTALEVTYHSPRYATSLTSLSNHMPKLHTPHVEKLTENCAYHRTPVNEIDCNTVFLSEMLLSICQSASHGMYIESLKD